MRVGARVGAQDKLPPSMGGTYTLWKKVAMVKTKGQGHTRERGMCGEV